MKENSLNHTSNKVLIFKSWKEHLQLKSKGKKITQLKNKQSNWIDIYPHKDTQMPNRYLKRYSASLNIREMQMP